jgi:5-methylcytosine-specific restriction endonuclease McrA
MEITVVYRENNKKCKNKLCVEKGNVKVSWTVVHIITILLFKGDCPNIRFTGSNLA